ARTVEVVGELSASRASSYLAAESLYDVDGPQARPVGAAVRSPQQLAGHSSGWTPAPQESGALLPRQQLGALGGRYAGRRVDRVRRENVHHAERMVSQRRAESDRTLQPSLDELPHRPDRRGASEGAREAVEVRSAPMDVGRGRGLRVLLHQQQGARRVAEIER